MDGCRRRDDGLYRRGVFFIVLISLSATTKAFVHIHTARGQQLGGGGQQLGIVQSSRSCTRGRSVTSSRGPRKAGKKTALSLVAPAPGSAGSKPKFSSPPPRPKFSSPPPPPSSGSATIKRSPPPPPPSTTTIAPPAPRPPPPTLVASPPPTATIASPPTTTSTTLTPPPPGAEAPKDSVYEDPGVYADPNSVSPGGLIEVTSSEHLSTIIFKAAGGDPDHLGYVDGNGVQRKPHKLLMVFVHASWCRACAGLRPKLLRLMTKHPEVLCAKLNKGENEELAKKLGIRGLPTFILYKNGKRIDHITTNYYDDIEEAVLDNT